MVLLLLGVLLGECSLRGAAQGLIRGWARGAVG